MQPQKITKKDIKDYWVNDGPKLVFVVLWVIANIAVFAERFYHFAEVVTLPRELLGYCIPLAKGSAAALKLNSALLLLTVLRNIISYVRGTWLGSYLPMDKNIVFHKKIAWAVVFFTYLHGFAHYENYNRQQMLTDVQALSLGAVPPIPSPVVLGYGTVAGLTGHLVCLCLVLMVTSATLRIRSPMFEVFWFSHHLFIPYFVLICFHGIYGLLGPPDFWAWVIGPMFLYAVERTIRLFRGNQTTILQRAIQHPSRVIELQMRKTSFHYKPGQYLFLQCPWVGSYEWHPFTITSCPEEDFVSVHIRIVGDWTRALAEFLNPTNKMGVVQEELITGPDGDALLRFDGPFGAAAEEAIEFSKNGGAMMLIAAGIGVTPYASILKAIALYRTLTAKVYFYWISPDKAAFEWFSDLLKTLEQSNQGGFLEINIHLTGALSQDEIRNIMYGDGTEEDQVTGLATRTNFGRPKWKDIFEEKARQHPDQEVSVFFCGPNALSKSLYKNCVKVTKQSTTKFRYQKENF